MIDSTLFPRLDFSTSRNQLSPTPTTPQTIPELHRAVVQSAFITLSNLLSQYVILRRDINVIDSDHMTALDLAVHINAAEQIQNLLRERGVLEKTSFFTHLKIYLRNVKVAINERLENLILNKKEEKEESRDIYNIISETSSSPDSIKWARSAKLNLSKGSDSVHAFTSKTINSYAKPQCDSVELVQKEADCKLLGIEPNFVLTEESIIKNYRKLALIHHPDKTGGDNETFIALQTARDRLMKGLVGEECPEFKLKELDEERLSFDLIIKLFFNHFLQTKVTLDKKEINYRIQYWKLFLDSINTYEAVFDNSKFQTEKNWAWSYFLIKKMIKNHLLFQQFIQDCSKYVLSEEEYNKITSDNIDVILERIKELKLLYDQFDLSNNNHSWGIFFTEPYLLIDQTYILANHILKDLILGYARTAAEFFLKDDRFNEAIQLRSQIVDFARLTNLKMQAAAEVEQNIERLAKENLKITSYEFHVSFAPDGQTIDQNLEFLYMHISGNEQFFNLNEMS